MSRLVQPTRILVVGGGGREHALAWKLAAEPGVNEVVVAPGSDAIGHEPRVRRATGVDPLDPAAIVALARERAVELAVIGPEAPLAAGVADALVAAGVATFGPSAAAARIETSKSFCHEIAAEAGVAMARSASFDRAEGPAAAGWAFDEARMPGSLGVVVKADGLASGKGVVVCDTADEAIAAIGDLVVGGVERLVIEERLAGPEASVITICDGRAAIALPAARDHKRLSDGDRGPNTGGMGAYSPLSDLDGDAVDAIVRQFHLPILAALARRGLDFRGFLYAGLILTKDGPRLLECNARLGDPEAQAILPRLAAPLGPWLLAAARGALPADAPSRLPELPGATVAIVAAAAGYPLEPRRGTTIEGIAAAEGQGALVFHAATGHGGGDTWRVEGGRVLAVVGRGRDLAGARDAAERAADAISWPGMQRRHDIGLVLPSAVGAAR
ncbi:MAG: phosphoribosylamine---glycine ligase [Chloroflexota bacterium]|nr:phosphoribosylamine---glycine ligase [Chloroflexota bacterium]